jgi:flagellar L-ring protein precursor FlgH
MKFQMLSAITFIGLMAMHCAAQTAPAEEAASSSLMATTPPAPPAPDKREDPHALRQVSMFAIAPIEPRKFVEHDLVQIIVRETSQAKSTHELDTKKNFKLDGKIPKWPDFNLTDLMNFRLKGGSGENTPELEVDFDKDFKGQGDYKRQDDLTARLTAEVIEVLPNGNLILEARTDIKMDEEETSMKVTGICRSADVTAANTVLSNQLHDLNIEKINKGELKKSNEKGIIAKVLETVFAF